MARQVDEHCILVQVHRFENTFQHTFEAIREAAEGHNAEDIAGKILNVRIININGNEPLAKYELQRTYDAHDDCGDN